MIKLIKMWLQHRKEARARNTCTCKHKYRKCAKKITVTGNGVIGVTGYFQCGRFVAKFREVSKKTKSLIK